MVILTFFARKTAILTKKDTFRHANEGGPAPREGGPAPGEWGPAGAPRPLPPPPVKPSAGPESTTSIKRTPKKAELKIRPTNLKSNKLNKVISRPTNVM